MIVYHFDKEKFSNNIDMELGIIENTSLDFTANLHCTDFFEILMFRKANGRLVLDGTPLLLKDNCFVFISPFQKRKWFVDQNKIKGHFLIFEKDFLNDFFADQLFIYRLQYFFNQNIPPYYEPDRRLFSFKGDIFEEMMYELKNTKQDSGHLLRSILYYILIKLNRKFCQYHHLEPDTQSNLLAYQFKELLETKLKSNLTVNEISKKLNTSRISLNKAIKKQFGVTAIEMLKNRLLHEVKSELMYSHKTIAEIAYELRFSEPNHLNRFFKERTTVTPKKFRDTYQNGTF